MSDLARRSGLVKDTSPHRAPDPSEAKLSELGEMRKAELVDVGTGG